MPALETRISPSSGSSAYPPSQRVLPNSSEPYPIHTDTFEGSISLWIKSSMSKTAGKGDEYFEHPKRSHTTYGLVIRGHFTQDLTADEVFWGNTFERPIRDVLPWGTSVMTRCMQWLDPTVTMDIYADKPWAMAYMLASMNWIALAPPGSASPSPGLIVEEDCSYLETLGAPKWEGDEMARKQARKAWFGTKENREKVKLKGLELALEFCNGYLDLDSLSVTLPRPFTLSIPLLRYWDGQPVTYVCQTANTVGEGVHFSAAFDIVGEAPSVGPEAGKVKPPTDEPSPSDAETSKVQGDGGDAKETSDDDVD